MSPKYFLPLALACVFLTACLGTEAKRLGNKSSATATSTDTDVESFSIVHAYRKDTNPDNGRMVALQGVRSLPSAALSNNCGTSGATCQCYFYKSTSDTSPVVGTISANGLSTANNSMTCSIPASVADNQVDTYTKVRLKTTDGIKSTGFINISTTLTLSDVIGDLAQNKVRGIYRYSCTRTFFEGTGVSATGVECPPSQNLGLITAPYSYYLYNSQLGGNLNKKGSNVAWDSAICERQFPRLTCDGTPEVRWGLYAEQTGIFQVGITMVANGVDSDASQIYGYAALTDSAGNCPTGLVKISQWEAQPQSIVQGSLTGSNPPSSFVNQSNNLNNKMVEESQPSGFVVSRQPNQTPCAASDSSDPIPGSCRNVSFNGSYVVQTVPYTKLTPVVCAIPKELINGLF